MTQEAQQIKDYVVNSNLPDYVKNEILPLLGVIDSPGVKERILKILEIEGKALKVEENILNINNDQLPVTPPPIPTPVISVQQATNPVMDQPVPPVPTPQPMTQAIPTPVVPQVNDDQTVRQLEDQLKQLQQK